MNFLKKIFKNFIVSALTIYGLNIFLCKLNILIPLNMCSLSISTILGFPGIITYVVLVYKFTG